jgi:hypothetical protein
MLNSEFLGVELDKLMPPTSEKDPIFYYVATAVTKSDVPYET